MCCLLALLFGWPLLLWRRPVALGVARRCARHEAAANGTWWRAAGSPGAAVAGLLVGALMASSLAVAEANWPQLASLHAPICRALLPASVAASLPHSGDDR